MKNIFAGAISLITVLAVLITVVSGIALVSDSSNADAWAVFPYALIVATIGSGICYAMPATRSWLATWINPF